MTRVGVLSLLLAVGCGKDVGGGLVFVDPSEIGPLVNEPEASDLLERDGGVDGGCPDYPDNGTVQLTRRGCPLTIDYSIR